MRSSTGPTASSPTANPAHSARCLELHVSAGRENGNAPTHRPHADDLPELPPQVVAELEQIAFRVSGEDARAARMQDLLERAETLRQQIQQWVDCVLRSASNQGR
jgi:hypothetical protein